MVKLLCLLQSGLLIMHQLCEEHLRKLGPHHVTRLYAEPLSEKLLKAHIPTHTECSAR